MRKRKLLIYLIAVSAVFSFVIPRAHTESLSNEEVVAYGNRIIKAIYNDIWRVRERYPQLKDFGPENLLNETLELPSFYSKIKKIRIKSAESEAKGRFFRKEEFRGDKDILYIAFSQSPKVYGTVAAPAAAGEVQELGLYILVYINSDDQFFKHDMIAIVRNDAVISEQISY
ncbi:MAG: hypothetical protein PHP17_03340 [Candidatus Omnitrophica bacterium]|nr:hypothetical protein [Candidatus Omnitrophota bacterium]